ncbi:MAG TPA: amino acid transport protein [Polyangia bacterium]|nr:amino acid transport protein [Polyangia bacterium]HVZ86523.1 amino acid transport protein [Polyangia bacterium]
MNLSAGWIIASLIISSIGFILLHYGRKMARVPQVVAGLAMLIYPYFVPGVLANVLVAAGIVAVLWLAVRLGW